MYAGYTQEQFMEEIGRHIQKKYPHLSFKLTINQKGTTLADMVAAREPIDLFLTAPSAINQIVDVQLAGDVSDLVQKEKVDLNRFDPASLEVVKQITGRLSGLPSHIDTYTMVYNKELFDQLGVPYPQDNMTWDEFYTVAGKMTRSYSGTQYYGFGVDAMGTAVNLNAYSLNLVDPATHRATLATDKWKSFFTNYERFYKLPGYDASFLSVPEFNRFTKDRTLATLQTLITKLPKQEPGWDFNWDMARLPVYADAPGVGPQASPVYFILSANSKHREEAFRVMTVLASEEVQKERAKRLVVPPLKDMSVVANVLGQDVASLKGKRIQSLLPARMAPANVRNRYHDAALKVVPALFNDLIRGTKDINTALRDAEEQANKAIEPMLIK
jgi:multiple sugar transport system substrate-binding protein